MSENFKKALLTEDTSVSIRLADRWLPIKDAYESLTQSLKPVVSQDPKRTLIKEVITPFYNDQKEYWGQFGFLMKGNVNGLAEFMKPHITVRHDSTYYHRTHIAASQGEAVPGDEHADQPDVIL